MATPQHLTPAGRRVVAAAEELFYERGITAVGVALIAEHAGVTKRTLYNQFGSKDRLVAAYLTERDRRWRALVSATVEACDDPLEAVTAPFAGLPTWARTSTRGCAFINALAELPDPTDPAHRVAVDQKAWLLTLFEDLGAAAGRPEPATLARQLLVLHEGALATLPLPLETLDASIDLARSLVTAGAPPGR